MKTSTIALSISAGIILVVGALYLSSSSDVPSDVIARLKEKETDSRIQSSEKTNAENARKEEKSQSDDTDLIRRAIPEFPEFTWVATRTWNLPLNNPPTVSRSEASFLRPDDTVVGIVVNGKARAYPWFVLANYHAVNDHIDGKPVIVNLCEACNGGAAFYANAAKTTLDFRPMGVKNGTWYGVDFQTGSKWYPFSGVAFEGPLEGTKLDRIPCFFSTWGEWAEDHPYTTVVLSSDEVRQREHGARSHMAIKENFAPDLLKRIISPRPNPRRDWLPAYELVFGLLAGPDHDAIAYTLAELRRRNEPVQTHVNGKPIVVFIQGNYQVSAFERSLDGKELELEVTSSEPFVLTDQLGNDWSVWGRSLSGPDHPANLPPADGYLTKWYEWIENNPRSLLVPGHETQLTAVDSVPDPQRSFATDSREAALMKSAIDPKLSGEVCLDDDRQELIWDLEHYTFELEWKFGKIVKEAIKNRDPDSLRECFLSGATGAVVEPDADKPRDEGWWHESKYGYKKTDNPPRDVAVSELVTYMMDVTSKLSEIQGVGLRVLAINPDDDIEHRYQLDILLTAKGRDANGPASLYSKHDVSVEFRNDEEIIAGKIIRDWDVRSVSIHGTKTPFFREVTEPFGLADLDLPDNWDYEPGEPIDTYTSQMAAADFDNDGFLDIIISTIQGNQMLLRNVDGERFEDVTKKMGLPRSRFFSYTTFATWIDYDNDGYPDLLAGKNLYHNEQGQRFRSVTNKAGLKFPYPAMGAVVADYDCDGWLDLYVLNHMGKEDGENFGFVADNSETGAKNQLYRNRGNGTFEDVTDEAGVSGSARHSFSASWFFANDDRYPDLYLVNDFGRNCLFINQGDGRFVDVTDGAGVGDFANSMGVATGDLNNDGTTEIYVANMFSKMGRRIIQHVSKDDYPEGVYRGIQGSCAGSHLYQLTPAFSSGDLVYKDISVEKHVNGVGWAYAPVMADFDADGLLDIYAASGFISTNRRKPDG